MLEWQKKEASVSLASKNSVQSGDSDSDEEEESKEPPIKLPKASNWYHLVLSSEAGVFFLGNKDQQYKPVAREKAVVLFVDHLVQNHLIWWIRMIYVPPQIKVN